MDPIRRCDSFHHTLGELLEDKQFTDITLVVAGEEIRAHKIILAASSLYFRRLFNSSPDETKTDRIEIVDFEPQTVKAMLEYMYRGVITKPEWVSGIEFYSNLLIVADKYQLDGLKSASEELLCSLATPHSERLKILASTYNLCKLKFILTLYRM